MGTTGQYSTVFSNPMLGLGSASAMDALTAFAPIV
jgi:hypothetical protein